MQPTPLVPARTPRQKTTSRHSGRYFGSITVQNTAMPTGDVGSTGAFSVGSWAPPSYRAPATATSDHAGL